MTGEEFEHLSGEIIGAAIEVHRVLGPGLLESAYRVDMVINEAVIVELKCIDSFQLIHTAQVFTYLKMTGLKLGLLLNFKVDVMRSGIKRVVNKL